MRIVTVARLLTLMGISLLILVGWRSYHGTLRAIDEDVVIARDHRIIDELSRTLIALQDAESGQRGYLLTGNESYLTAYERGVSSVDATIDLIDSLTHHDAVQHEKIEDLRSAISSKLDELENTIQLYQNAETEAALAIVRTDVGFTMMGNIHALLTTMDTHQRDLLRRRTQAALDRSNKALLHLMALIATATFLFLISGFLVSWALIRSRKQHSELTESHLFLRHILTAHPTESFVIAPGGMVLDGDFSDKNTPRQDGSEPSIVKNYTQAFRRLGPLSTEDTTALETGIRRVLKGAIDIYEQRLYTDEGASSTCYAIHARAMTMDSERHVLFCFTDITESENAYESARVNEEMFRLAMKNAPVGMALVSPAGAWIRVNNAICDIIGYTEEELLVTDFQTITHPDDLDKDLSLLQKMLNREIDTYHMEKRYLRKDGTPVWILLSVSLVWNTDGTPQHFISQIQDIDSRKKAEEEIRMGKERLELAIHGGELGTWDWRVSDGVTIFDERWATMLGHTLEELQPDYSTWDKLVHPDDKDEVIRALEEHLAGKSATYRAEHRLQHKDGSWVWVLTKGKVIERDASGAPARVCGTHLDITLQKNAQESLSKFAMELERSNRELEDFAHIASHDLKEPLRGIRNYATFLLEDYEDKLDDDGQSKLHTLVNLTTRLGDFIDALLQYSRVGQTELALHDVDLQVEVTTVIESLVAWMPQHHCTVRIIDELPTIRCHRVLAAEVFRNLITNGIKYNDKEEKEIEVGARTDEHGKTAFFVRDNGIGIPEKHHTTIFRIFKRLHGRDDFGGGTGAGLSITQKIIHRHQGKLWLESEEKVGTTFFFTFTKDAEQTPALPAPAS